MRRIVLITAVLGLAATALAPATAGAAQRSLELKITTGVLPSATRVDTEMNFTLTAKHGEAECRTYSEGAITNSSRVDDFTAESEHFTCDAAGETSEGSAGVSAFSLADNGKATTAVSVVVAWPAPLEPCTYTGSFRGSNTLSGYLNASFAGKLQSSCHEHRARAASSYWYTYAAFPEWDQLEAYVGTSG